MAFCDIKIKRNQNDVEVYNKRGEVSPLFPQIVKFVESEDIYSGREWFFDKLLDQKKIKTKEPQELALGLYSIAYHSGKSEGYWQNKIDKLLPKKHEIQRSVKNLTPALKMYENFIQTNTLYVGEDLLPLVGEFELDKSQSNYSPSLKIYEGFINLNQLYTGEEILPFIGESEYYRYLVPMLLKMNPGVKTMFTQDLVNSMIDQASRSGQFSENAMDNFIERLILSNRSKVAASTIGDLNMNFIRNDVETKSVVHELIHRTLQKEYEKGGEFKQKIDELYSYSDDRAKSDSYGFSSPTEFLAEAMSNPEFMEELNNIPYQNETIFSYLMTLISSFINNLLNIELNSDSVLASVVRASEQILNRNLTELSQENPVSLSELQSEVVSNWTNYFPNYDWMNLEQRQVAAKLIEEGKLTLTCKL